MHKIVNGLKIGMRDEMREPALKFMQENGYRINEAGKRVACNDISQLIDDAEESTALQLAIMSL